MSVILLGAGQPFRGQTPSPLIHTPDKRLVLDWILDAFSGLSAKVHFVGGYHLEDIVRQYPQITYSINPDWQKTGSIQSLLAAPLTPDETYYVSYTDIVFRQEAIRQMQESHQDVVIAMDSSWRKRYESRALSDMASAEKVALKDNQVVSIGKAVGIDLAQGEFIGLVRFSPKAIQKILELRQASTKETATEHLAYLINTLITEGLSVEAVDIHGEWAELNAPQDLAKFVLGTKAQTLSRLRPLVQKSRIGELLTIRLADWQADSAKCLQEVHGLFGDSMLVIRSSALTEDGWDCANAGAYLSLLNIPGGKPEAVEEAINQVAASYPDNNHGHEVLVQKMLTRVLISGVAFTRTLTYGAPYYIINYDDTTFSTDSVTSGSGEHLKTLVLHRSQSNLPAEAHPLLAGLLPALREAETLVGHDSLDIEFAITEDGQVHLFQLRPIAVDHSTWCGTDTAVEQLLAHAEGLFRDKQASSPFIVGDHTLFGVMPDWNPAEIIGTKPRRLAFSLYRYLIMDETWATQRMEFGYRDVRPHPLMVSFAGHPYVDIRASFNSFIPAALPDELAKRLVLFYLSQLESNPHWHDKIEFQIAFTCLTLDFEHQSQRLLSAGFTPQEIDLLSQALREITHHAFERSKLELKTIKRLEQRFSQIQASPVATLDQAFILLEDCRRYGTLAFSHLARCAFVAVSLLKSAVQTGVMTEEEMTAYLNTMNTVAKDFTTHAAQTAAGKMQWEEFVGRYGHLRPGTYDITSPCYANDPERYLQPLLHRDHSSSDCEPPCSGSWTKEQQQRLSQALKAMGLPDDPHRFDTFVRESIEGREYAKFMFTRHLSQALECLTLFGKDYGLSPEHLSHIALEDFSKLRSGQQPADIENWLLQCSKEGQFWFSLTQGIELPALLRCADDLRRFIHYANDPNFVSHGKVIAETVCLTSSEMDETAHLPDLKGKIVLIPQADPGYDWLFGYRIGGLITAYGGANSHMAIRAAEFNLPAAIGVGEMLFQKLSKARNLCLDCSNRRIEVLQ